MVVTAARAGRPSGGITMDDERKTSQKCPPSGCGIMPRRAIRSAARGCMAVVEFRSSGVLHQRCFGQALSRQMVPSDPDRDSKGRSERCANLTGIRMGLERGTRVRTSGQGLILAIGCLASVVL